MSDPSENSDDFGTNDAQPTATSVYSPGVLKLMFDFVFFANYVIGWTLTIIFQPEAVWNNNIARTFFVYNICIGVDSLPAQPIALLIYIVAFFILSCFYVVLWQGISLSGRGFQCARRLLVVGAWCGSASFFLTYGVRPDNPLLAYIHDSGFAGGTLGYALCNLATIVEFYALGDQKQMSLKHKLYFGVQAISGLIYFIAFCMLVHGISTAPMNEMAANINSAVFPAVVEGGYEIIDRAPGDLFHGKFVGPMEKEIKVGFSTPFLVAVVFLQPILCLPLMPKNMKLQAEWSFPNVEYALP